MAVNRSGIRGGSTEGTRHIEELLGPAGAVEAIDHHGLLVYGWRVGQLTRAGVPSSLGQADADCVDWHRSAHLVHRGCLPRLALPIVR